MTDWLYTSNLAISPPTTPVAPASISPLVCKLFKHTPFASHFELPYDPTWLLPQDSYVSPVVRASDLKLLSSPRTPQHSNTKTRQITPFIDKLRKALPNDLVQPCRSTNLASPALLSSPCLSSPLTAPSSSLLKSNPSSLLPPQTPAHPFILSPVSPLTPITSPTLSSPTPPAKAYTYPESPAYSKNPRKRRLETPDSPTPSRPPKKRPSYSLRPAHADGSVKNTSVMDIKSTVHVSPMTPAYPASRNCSVSVSPAPSSPNFTTRNFPASVEISPYFPLFYRRFPASSYFPPSPRDADASKCVSPHRCHPLNANSSPRSTSVSKAKAMTAPKATPNPPRTPLDLYTPRLVQGRGASKLGLCPICVEPRARGGQGRKVWLAMKFSAFKWSVPTPLYLIFYPSEKRNTLTPSSPSQSICHLSFHAPLTLSSYHMQYGHGRFSLHPIKHKLTNSYYPQPQASLPRLRAPFHLRSPFGSPRVPLPAKKRNQHSVRGGATSAVNGYPWRASRMWRAKCVLSPLPAARAC